MNADRRDPAMSRPGGRAPSVSSGTETIESAAVDAVAAPLDLLLADAVFGPLRRVNPGGSGLRLAAALARRPRLVAGRGQGLLGELGRIALGTSTVQPSRRDRRFTDPGWMGNPLLRRAMQAYLAAAHTAEGVVGDADLDWADAERVGFALRNVIDALAPSNSPVLNPAALKAAIDTGGGSLLTGLRHLIADMAARPRVPSMVEPDAFEVGVDLAVTPGVVVLRTPVFELIQYRPATERVRHVPLLIVPPTINKFYVIDLAPGRSLAEYLVGRGQQVFMISWRNPDSRHAHWDLDTYGQAVLEAMDAVSRITRSEQTALMGICSGGIIAAMVAAHLAHTGRQDRIAALTLLVTVLDQARAGLASAVIGERKARAAAAASQARGYLDGRALAEVFAWLRPNDLIWNYWVNNYLLGRQPPPFDILFWNADATRMTAGLHGDFLRLAVANTLVAAGRRDDARVAGGLVAGQPGLLPGRRDHRPHLSLDELLPLDGAARGDQPVRAVHQRAHRRHGESARQREGRLPGGQGVPRRPAGVAPARGEWPRILVAGLRGLAGRALR